MPQQRSSQCRRYPNPFRYLKSVTSDTSWGKDSLWVVTTGAQLRPEEEARGARRTNSGQRSALGVATRLYWGQEFRFSRSEPLDQAVKTKLIPCLSHSSLRRCLKHIAGSIQVKSNEHSGTTTTIRVHYGSSRKHQKLQIIAQAVYGRNKGHLRAGGY